MYHKLLEIKLKTREFGSLADQKKIVFAINLRSSQSAGAKSTFHLLCGIY